MVCRQLQLYQHHVVAKSHRQVERGRTGEEIIHLQGETGQKYAKTKTKMQLLGEFGQVVVLNRFPVL